MWYLCVLTAFAHTPVSVSTLQDDLIKVPSAETVHTVSCLCINFIGIC